MFFFVVVLFCLFVIFITITILLRNERQVAELSTVKAQFQKKYGYEFVRAAELNEGGCVNPKVVEKLDCQPPSAFVITVGAF